MEGHPPHILSGFPSWFLSLGPGIYNLNHTQVHVTKAVHAQSSATSVSHQHLVTRVPGSAKPWAGADGKDVPTAGEAIREWGTLGRRQRGILTWALPAELPPKCPRVEEQLQPLSPAGEQGLLGLNSLSLSVQVPLSILDAQSGWGWCHRPGKGT